MDLLRVFVGYDPREALAYHVCVNSMIRHASRPLLITPLALNYLPYRETHTDGSNAFIYSRFLVPYLCGFSGTAIYLDGDMIVRDDIYKLAFLNEHDKDVMVVKHDYKTKASTKYFGNKNEDYPRKNWSSVMLFNCANYPNQRLLPEFVEKQTGAFLHRFQWLDDNRIGSLPKEWNWLVGEYEHNENAKLLHWTLGAPFIHGYENADHAELWWSEYHKTVGVSE